MTEPTRRTDPDDAAWLTIADWPGGTIEVFDELSATHADDLHVGLLARYCGQLPDALRIVAVWASREDAERFFERLPAANRARLAPAGAPAVSGFAAQRAHHATGS